MSRDEILQIVAAVVGEELAHLRQDLTDLVRREVAAKPVPPFMPPPIWTVGLHPASSVVRHVNGLFLARRDTPHEPPGDDWLPLVVGLAGFDMRWSDDRTFVAMARLSDGRVVETSRELAVPIVRGFWNAEATYKPGDRVFRYGEWSALKLNLGVDPTADDAGNWEKISGKYAKAPAWKLDDDGKLTEGGREVGDLRPLFIETVERAVEKALGKAAA